MTDITPTELAVLKVMHSKRIYGTNHKSINTIIHAGFPRQEAKNVRDAIHSLLRKRIVIWYHKGNKAIQLDKTLFTDIDNLIKNSLR